MSPDRYGEADVPTARCRDPRCKRGWLGEDDEGRRIPCLACKPHLIRGTTTTEDYAEREPSARARAAIEADERRNP